jgi:hypothetical protein
MSWESWFQDVAGSVIGKAADAKYTQPYEIDKLRIQALGDLGYYTEGQAGTKSAPVGVLGMSQGTVLLIGAVVLGVLMLRD